MKSIKKLQLVTIISLISTVLIMITGLIFIGFCNFHKCIIKASKLNFVILEKNGFNYKVKLFLYNFDTNFHVYNYCFNFFNYWL